MAKKLEIYEEFADKPAASDMGLYIGELDTEPVLLFQGIKHIVLDWFHRRFADKPHAHCRKCGLTITAFFDTIDSEWSHNDLCHDCFARQFIGRKRKKTTLPADFGDEADRQYDQATGK